MPRACLIALGLCLPLLAGCVASDLDFDMRPDPISTRGAGETAPRPAPDANGLITYDSYQVAVARRGDTVASVAARIGMDPTELARFNGRQPTDTLRSGEILALPRRVSPGGAGGTDIASIASGAIDAAEAQQGTGATAPAVQPGAEPVRHRVGRGETAYSIARLYSVSVRSLAEWNGLGPDLAVREGQYLIIPIVIEQSVPTVQGSAPGTSVAPPPPSAATPLPAPIEQATLPQSGTQAAAPAAAPAPAPTSPAASSSARFAMPVSGSIIRPYGNGNEGIDIGAAAGTPVRAAGDGEVAAITQDTDQIPILVVRHPDGLLSVYANIRNITVARGDSVTQGQTIAEVGPGDPSFLHFEVRRGFEAVDPTQYLP
jgi:murein DD-endopeptidase MepM/ murein hydrolase activator NlpD